jgi:hypothetical protein
MINVVLLSVDMMNMAFYYYYSERHHTECHYGECHFDECSIFICYTEHHYAKCRSAPHCPWIRLIKYLAKIYGASYKITKM